jgi:PAS domain S-box-containing protein
MQKKILIVDDNRTNLYLLKSMLESEGLKVIMAENGKDALDKAHVYPPDLIVSDILMPVMDGYTLCRQCKSDETLKNIPFVFYTATYTEQKDENFALSLGADRFVLKPQEPEALIQILKEVWEERSEPGAAAPKPLGEEMEFIRQHNEILFSKLEKKMLDLEKANRKLKCLEEQYRLSFENVTDIVLTIDADLKIEKMSPSVEKLVGYKPLDLIGQSISDLFKIFVPESTERAMTEISLILKGETISASVYSIIARDGTVKHGEVSGSPIFRNGEIVGVVSVIRDITQRKQTEEELRAAYVKRQELDFIVNHSPTIVWLWKAAEGWPVEYVSDNITYYGYTPDDFTSGRIAYASIIHPDDLSRIGAEVEQYVHEGRNEITQEYRIFTKSGDIRWIDDRTWVRRGPDEIITHYQGIAIDITERKLAEKALRNTQELLNEVERIGKIGGWEMDLINRKATWTQGTYDIVEIDPSQPIPGPDEHVNYYLPEFRPLVAEAMRALIEEGKPLDFEAKLLTAKGNVKWCRAMGMSSRKGGKVVKVYGTFQDITERKMSEEALESERNLLRNLIDNLPDRIYAKDRESRFVICNDAMVRRMGKTSMTEIMGKSDFDLLPLEMAQRFYDDEQAIIQSGKAIINREEPLTIESGKITRWSLATKVPLRDSYGNTIGMVGVGRDITERKQAEDSLRKSEARFRSYFELPLIGIAITSAEKGWIEGNSRLSEILGYSWQELKHMTWSELTHPEDLAADVEQFNRVLAGDIDSYMIDKRFIRKDGKVIWTGLAAGCVRNRDGTVDHFVVLLEDITERKESVVKLRKSLEATVQAIAVIVETRDPYTAGHQRRVTALAQAIAAEMNLSSDQIDGMHMAGSIHDLGKISIPAEILSKPTKLSDVEYRLIKTHAQSGYDILKDIQFPWPVARMVLEHHERINGSGYPNGLTGDKLLVESRIITVADVVEAMASHRPYRPAKGMNAALEEITRNRGVLYDIKAVDACLRLFNEKCYRL